VLVAVLAGHDFALVLTHDVACRLDIELLADLESDVLAFARAVLPVCSEVTHPFALNLTTLAERNWLGGA